jgi:hypothetical protein
MEMRHLSGYSANTCVMTGILESAAGAAGRTKQAQINNINLQNGEPLWSVFMIFCQILAADEENVFVIQNFFVLIAWLSNRAVHSWKARKS